MKRCFFLITGLLCAAGAQTIEQIVADPQLWPAEVIVVATTKGGLVKNGRVSGMILIGAGKKLTVSGIAADGVTGKLGGATVKVPIEQTDLLRRLKGSAEAPARESVAAPPAPAPPAENGAPSAMQRRLSGKLVRLSGSALQPVDDASLAGVKYYGLYYSASWCDPCRQFTPLFVSAYRKLKQTHPEFEVVFISDDHTAGEMHDYMKEDRMPWLALKYDLRARNPELIRYAGPGIPCLVLVDAAGRVLSDSFQGDKYLGPGHVLDDATRILQGAR